MADEYSVMSQEELLTVVQQLSTEGSDLNRALDRIHSIAVQKWSEGKEDGWLKIMQLADPGVRASGRRSQE